MKARKLWIAFVAFVVVAAACSETSADDEPAGPDASVPALDDELLLLLDEPGLQLRAQPDAGLDADGFQIEQVEPGRTQSVAGPDGDDIVIGDVYRIESLNELDETLTLRMPVQADVDPATQTIAYFDDQLEAWVGVETTQAGDWLTAESDHLSDWAVVDSVALSTWWVSRIIGLRAEPPTCTGDPPTWVTAIEVDTSPNAELRVCGGSDEQSGLELTIVNNRAVPTWLLLSHAASEPPRTSDDPLLATVVAEMARALGHEDDPELQSAAQVILLPALGSTELTFEQAALITAADDDETTLVGNSRRDLPVIAAHVAIELLTILGGDTALAVSVGLYKCAAEVDQWDDIDWQWNSGGYPILEFIRSYIGCVGAATATVLAAPNNPDSKTLEPLRKLSTFLKWFDAAKLAAALADVSLDSLDQGGDDLQVALDYCGDRPTLADIGTRSWQSDVFGTVETVNGRFDGQGFFELLPETFVALDVNGDCQQDVVVISRENGGGSGIFYRLRVLVAEQGGFVEANTIPIGDRIVVESVSATTNGVQLELVVQAPGAGLAGPNVDTSAVLSYNDLLTASSLPEELTLPPVEPEQPEEPSSGAAITHAEIKAAFAVEPNIHYVGSCDGSVFFDDPRPSGATPFCGTILATGDGIAAVAITDDGGFESILDFEQVDGVWTWALS